MKRIAIVSPSGNLYGSEYVLLDFLLATRHRYEVYVPQGKLHNALVKQAKHRLRIFNSLALLYARLAMRLLLHKIDGIYINEGGHIRYLNLLARMFSNKSFFVHIRLLEDTDIGRLQGVQHNVTLISVSDYITDAIDRSIHRSAITIYDLYKPAKNAPVAIRNLEDGIIRAGVVGRLTDTKGIDKIIEFCDYIDGQSTLHIEMHFFGDINRDSAKVSSFISCAENYNNVKCIFHGFVTDKSKMYGEIDILLHFNMLEPLGRIAFEALDYGKPFVGFNRGGIGEIASHLGLTKYMADPESDSWCERMAQTITTIVQSNDPCIKYAQASAKMRDVYSVTQYVEKIEYLFR